MAQARILSAIIKQGTYDIMSADTDFYAFLTETRLYSMFTQLLHRDDVQSFIEHAESLDEKNIVLRLVAVDGEIHPFYGKISLGSLPGQLKVTLIDIAHLVKDEEELHLKLKTQGKLLELYGDDMMIYYHHTDSVLLISDYNLTHKKESLPLAQFEQRLREHTEPDEYENVRGFIASLKNGEHFFEISVKGSIVDDNQDVEFSIIKCATVYDKGERMASIGYIHKAKDRAYESEHKLEVDSLTGLLGKSAITNMAIRTIDVEKRKNVSIAIVDIDYFKKVNDTHGHMVGDEVIKKIASILEAEVSNRGVVGRIGGDEFLIVFDGVYDLEDARELLRGIKSNVVTSYPPNNEDKPVLSLSIGCASYPKDADTYKDVFALADAALYVAKEKGRNRYIIYDVNKHGTLEDIKKSDTMGNRINSRGDMSQGDILCVLMDKVYNDKEYSLEKLLDDYNDNFESQRITIFDADKVRVLYMVGQQVLSAEVIEETQHYIHGDFWKERAGEKEVVLNHISHVEAKDIETYNLMKKQGIISCIHIKFKDKNGADCIISFESVSKNIVWNSHHLHYYRLMARLLSNYVVV